MSRKVSSIQEINDTKETWKIAIRVTNLYCVKKTARLAGYIQMIFMDAKGDRIEAIVKSSDSDKWKNELREGHTYVIQNFEVQLNGGQYKISLHPYKLIFMKGTMVKEVELPEIPQYLYEFCDFENILGGTSCADVLVDVIGQFINIDRCDLGSKPEKVVFNLKDQRDNILCCTLWEEYATQLSSFLHKHEGGVIVVLLTLAKIKYPTGPYPTTVQNTYGSKLLINDNVTEIQQYKIRLDETEVHPSYSQKMTQLSSFSQVSSEDRFFHNAEVKSITEIKKLKKECCYVTVARVEKILAANGWSYEGCSKCNRKCTSSISPYICVCGQHNSTTVAKFRVEIKVSHNAESSKFILWDRECSQLLNKTANQLKEELNDAGECDPRIVPEPVDNLIGQTFAFKIKAQPNHERCSVIEASKDAHIIESIMQKIPKHEDGVSCEKGKSVCSLLKEDDIQSLSATADFDPDLLGSSTPAKRLSSDVFFDDSESQELTSAQLSSTKLTKHIKTE